MDFRRLTSRPIAGTAEEPSTPPTQQAPAKEPPTVRPRPKPPKRAEPTFFTAAKGTRLHFYRVHPDSGETLELLGLDDAKQIAAAVADLRTEEAWCLYLENTKGQRRLVAVSAAMDEALLKYLDGGEGEAEGDS